MTALARRLAAARAERAADEPAPEGTAMPVVTYADDIGPGVYDMAEDVYHADPVPGGSLSASGAKLLLPPSCPAKYRYEQDNPQPYKKAFDIGHAAHKLILGAGPNLVCVDRPRWDTNDVKAQVANIRATGGIPLKLDEYQEVREMAAAIRRDPLAPHLLDPTLGRAEVSLVARDPEAGVMLRSRADWLLNSELAGVAVVDYKTTKCVEPGALSRDMYSYGYHIQAAFYLYVLRLLGLATNTSRFLFLAQEKTPPYLTTFYEPDDTALAEGYARVREGIERYRDCTESGIWPGYTTDVVRLSLPRYATYRSEEY